MTDAAATLAAMMPLIDLADLTDAQFLFCVTRASPDTLDRWHAHYKSLTYDSSRAAVTRAIASRRKDIITAEFAAREETGKAIVADLVAAGFILIECEVITLPE